MRGVPAQGGSSDVLLATPPGGSLRARWARTRSLRARVCHHRCPDGPVAPDRAVDPADGGVSDGRGPRPGAGAPRIKPTGRASRPGYRVAHVEHALAGLHQLRAMSIPDGQRLRQPQGSPAACGPARGVTGRGSGRRREELKGDSVRVAEGDPGAVMGVLDPAMNDAELVQPRDPCPQLITVAAGE